MVLSEMNPILLELWREKHPQGLEQFALDFENVAAVQSLKIANDNDAGFSALPFPNALNRRVGLKGRRPPI
jgi:hypothetical protein